MFFVGQHDATQIQSVYKFNITIAYSVFIREKVALGICEEDASPHF